MDGETDIYQFSRRDIVKTQLYAPSSVSQLSLELEVLHPRRGAPYVNLKCYSAAPM